MIRENDPAADFWNQRYLSQDSVWSLEPNELVSERLLGMEPGHMVDLAGGEGRNALAFAAKGWEVENVEISSVALAKFAERAKRVGVEGQITSTLGDAVESKFQLKPSLVVIAYLQLPFMDLSRALSNAMDQLEPGGLLFGVFHGDRNLTDGTGGPQDPSVLPTSDQLEGWLGKAGLKGQVAERVRVVETDLGRSDAIDLTIEVHK